MKKNLTSILLHSILFVSVFGTNVKAQTGCNTLFGFHQTANTLTINFADSSTSPNMITSWLWNFGDGDSSTSQNPSHAYTHDSTYYACLTIHDAHGCSSTICHHVTVTPVAQTGCHASFGSHQTTNTLTINFADSSSSPNTITSWLWNFGDGDSSTSQNPSHAYTHDSTYYVCLTIHDAHGCSSTICHHITVNPVVQTGCHALFGFHQTANALTINFTDSSASANTITSWLWDFGDGHTSTSQNPSHTYAHDTTYYACLTIHDAHGCSNTICHHVIVNPVAQTGCHAWFGFHQTANALTINFTDSSASANTITSWLWDFGDGHTSTFQNPSHTYAHDGTFYICLTIHDAHGCSNTICHHITVSPVTAPCHASFTFHADSSGYIFSNTSSGTTIHTTYSWNFGDGDTSVAENPQHAYIHTGHYTVCLFISDSTTGCSAHFCHTLNNHHTLSHYHLALIAQTTVGTQSRTRVMLDTPQYIVSYPNPFIFSANIQYELTYDADVKIEIYDFLGNMISEISKGTESEGVHTRIISSNNLNPGFYLIKMTVDGELFSKKIAVMN